MKARIYKITVTKAYVASMELGTGYSLYPWGNDTDHYEGHDDGGKLYVLPEGFEVAKSTDGTLEIYDQHGSHYSLTSAGSHPMITNGHNDHHLKRA